MKESKIVKEKWKLLCIHSPNVGSKPMTTNTVVK